MQRDVTLYMPTSAQLEELLAEAKAFAECWVAGDAPSVRPHLIVLGRDLAGQLGKTLIACAMPFTQPADTRRAMRQLGALMYEQKSVPLAVALISQAWRGRLKANEVNCGRALQDDPGAEDGVLVAAVGLTGGLSLGAYRPVRTRIDRLLAWAGPWEESREATFTLIRHFFHGFFGCVPGLEEQLAAQRAGLN